MIWHELIKMNEWNCLFVSNSLFDTLTAIRDKERERDEKLKQGQVRIYSVFKTKQYF